MAVYALYIPTARRPVSGIGMERFASRELTGRELLQRNATGRSKTFYVADGRQPWDRPEVQFPQADETGYMRVFLRCAKDPVPELLDTPDEEWIVEQGGRQGKVIRLPWDDTPEQLAVLGGQLRMAPVRGSVPAYEVRTPTTAAQAAEPCGACNMLPSLTGRCGCS